ncbi:MAG: hypothetical protein IKA22_02820 [Lentisphaeria bacterium]|nr:hypothetical protein [Lentisphaeria bacterium]
MQQKQNKTEASTKKSNSFGHLMLQKDKNRFQMKEKQAYFEWLKAPRGKEYIRLLGKIRELAEQLAAEEEEIKKLQQEIGQETDSPPTKVPDTEHTPEPIRRFF